MSFLWLRTLPIVLATLFSGIMGMGMGMGMVGTVSLTLVACSSEQSSNTSAPAPTGILQITNLQGDVHNLLIATLKKQGAKKARGYIRLSDLGNGNTVILGAKNGQKMSLKASYFPARYRLFVRREGDVQLVRYKNKNTAAPLPGARDQGQKQGKHRSRWETLLKTVQTVQFTNEKR